MSEMTTMTTNKETTKAAAGESIFDRRQPRVCGCGRHEGQEVEMGGQMVPLVVNRGYVGRDRDGEPVIRFVCRLCARQGVPCRKLKFVYADLARLHKQWEQRQKMKQAEREVARAKRETQLAEERAQIEAEIWAVLAGTAKTPFLSCEEKDGVWRCVRSGCSCQKAAGGKPKPVRTIAVIGSQICRVCCVVAGVIHDLQSRGVREVGVWGFGMPGDEKPGKRTLEEALAKAKGHLGWLKAKAHDEQRARSEPPSRPQFVPGPRVMTDPQKVGETEASRRAKERQQALVEALRRGEGLEAVCPVRERAEGADDTWSVVLRHNQAMDVLSAAKRKKGKGGKEGGRKGGRRGR